FRKRGGQLTHRFGKLRGRAGFVGAGSQAAERGVATLVALLELLRSRKQCRCERRWNEQIELQREDRSLKTFRRDADDRQLIVIDTNGLTDGGRRPGEMGLPIVV